MQAQLRGRGKAIALVFVLGAWAVAAVAQAQDWRDHYDVKYKPRNRTNPGQMVQTAGGIFLVNSGLRDSLTIKLDTDMVDPPPIPLIVLSFIPRPSGSPDETSTARVTGPTAYLRSSGGTTATYPSESMTGWNFRCV